MKAAVLEQFGQPFVVEEVDLVEPGERDIVVRMDAAAYCMTDGLSLDGVFGKKPPTILGHSAVGVVERVGAGVTRMAVGDRVVMAGTPECGICRACVRGRPDQCHELRTNVQTPAVIGRNPAGVGVTLNGVGAYAEKMLVPEFWALPTRSRLDDHALAMMGCGITTGLGAVFRTAQVAPGAAVAVQGCGQLGLWMVQGARIAGASRIIAIDPIAERRELALRLGATDAIDPSAEDPVAAVRALTEGLGADVTLEASADVAAIQTALEMTDTIGVLVLTVAQDIRARIDLPSVEFALRGRDIRSCQNGRAHYRDDVPRYEGMLESGVLEWEPLVGAVLPLDQIGDAYTMARERTGLTPILVP